MTTSWLDALIGPPTVYAAGVAQPVRPGLNFIGATVADNPREDRIDLTFAGAVTPETTTISGTISSGSTWTAAMSGLSCASNKVTMLDVECVIRRTSNGNGAYFRRTVGVHYVSGSWGIIGQDVLTVCGATLAEEMHETGYDFRFVLTAGSGALAFQAYAPAAAVFSVRYRKTEL